MRASSATVVVIFSKVLFRKLLCYKVSSQQLKGTLETAFWKTSYGLGCFGHGSGHVLILSSRLWYLSWNENQRRCLQNYHSQKKATPHFKAYCIKIDDILIVVIHFFFQTNLAFKPNPVFIDILDSFCHSLFFKLLLFYFYRYSTEFIQCL